MANTGQRYRTSSDTVKIASDLSDKEHYLVNRAADNTVAIAADATKPMFVLIEGMDGSSTAGVGTIAVGGLEGTNALAKLGGTVTAGDKLTSDSSGLSVTTTTENDLYYAVALQSGVANDIIPVDFLQNGTVEG